MSQGFVPMLGFSNPHFQTILPTLLNKNETVTYEHQQLDLPDGDFLDLAWFKRPQTDERPIIVIFHGLEGSVHSPYAFRMMRALDVVGFNSVVMHYRGCFGTENRHARAYHSGETGDGRFFIETLVSRYPKRPIGAVGYSLGGNMLMKMQGEWGSASPLFAAVSVSAPLQLALSAEHINRGVSRFYQRLLMKSLKRRLLEKFEYHDYKKLIGLEKEVIPKLKSFWEYDDHFTGPIHGFKDAAEYYQRSSAFQFLPNITIPTLIIHAKDDPFMPPEILPSQESLPQNITLEVSAHGGHVGFVGGTIYRPVYWLQDRIPSFFTKILQEHIQYKGISKNPISRSLKYP